jgi:hypothetical protein
MLPLMVVVDCGMTSAESETYAAAGAVSLTLLSSADKSHDILLGQQ